MQPLHGGSSSRLPHRSCPFSLLLPVTIQPDQQHEQENLQCSHRPRPLQPQRSLLYLAPKASLELQPRRQGLKHRLREQPPLQLPEPPFLAGLLVGREIFQGNTRLLSHT